MLKSILTPNTCKECKICCNYSEKSLWDIPGFTKIEYERTIKDFPHMKDIAYYKNNLYYFTPTKKDDIYLCPFLSNDGCKLGGKKPFKCAIWPLYVVTDGGDLYIAVSKVCPHIPNIKSDIFHGLLHNEYLEIRKTVETYPELIEKNRAVFRLVAKL